MDKLTTVLITGANGQLGNEFRQLAGTFPQLKLLFTDVEELDILNETALLDCVKRERPDYIVNCAAYTNVEKAEDNGVTAYSVNGLAVKKIAGVAKKYTIGCIHISTDYVFDGKKEKPYTETDQPAPINVYGLTKFLGEYELSQINPPNSMIIRTSWLYSEFGNNFVKTIRRISQNKSSLQIVDDQVGSPTYAGDLATSILKILPYKNDKKVEIFNFANQGKVSWFEFAQEIILQSEMRCEVTPVSSEQFPTIAKRPKNSMLNTMKFENTFDIKIQPWKESLKRCISKLDNKKAK